MVPNCSVCYVIKYFCPLTFLGLDSGREVEGYEEPINIWWVVIFGGYMFLLIFGYKIKVLFCLCQSMNCRELNRWGMIYRLCEEIHCKKLLSYSKEFYRVCVETWSVSLLWLYHKNNSFVVSPIFNFHDKIFGA